MSKITRIWLGAFIIILTCVITALLVSTVLDTYDGEAFMLALFLSMTACFFGIGLFVGGIIIKKDYGRE
ncbi:MAG: hypothetical protein LBM01_03100 [Christensenellaceae bacterium]|jgi:hypothetical protein|nr:hypothetical protein [Christensenellaceae bacterium]